MRLVTAILFAAAAMCAVNAQAPAAGVATEVVSSTEEAAPVVASGETAAISPAYIFLNVTLLLLAGNPG
jgi:hypothetical protein